MIRRYAAVLALLALAFTAKAQSGAGFGFEYRPAAKVVEGADTLRLAWAGGMNTPQFSNIDLNGDGQADLFAFDRQSSRCYTFLNVAAAGGGRRWDYAPDYEKLFPTNLSNWALLRDFNCDGRPDLFSGDAGSRGFIQVYRNVAGTGGRPSFVLAKDTLSFTGNFPGSSKLLIDGSSMPDIRDVNGDGRLDLVSYFFGGAVNMELYLGNGATACGGSLDFTLADGFWGRIVPCGSCTGFQDYNARRCHAARGAHTPGHNVTLLDLDGDGDLDLIDGRDNCAELTRLLNMGNSQVARFDTLAVTSEWPSAAAPAQAGVFPGAYSLDANFDGHPDLIVAPNAFNNLSDKVTMRNTVKVLPNSAAGNVPSFGLPTGFLQPEMLDVSEEAAPTFGDINGDGLIDMLVGNNADAVGGQYRAALAYYRNVGTRTRPIFKLVDADYLGLSSRGISPNQFIGLKPVLVDLNRDRALDLAFSVYNNGANFIYYILNTAAAGQPMAFNAANANFIKGRGVAGATAAGIIPYQRGDAPCFTDVDGDGYVDLLVGTDEVREPGMSLRYFRQLPGVRLDTAFAITDSDYGRIRTTTGNRPQALHPTVADFDGDGQLDLMTIDASGVPQLFSNFRVQTGIFSSRTDLVYNALSGNYEEPRLGHGYSIYLSVAGADVNGDGAPELFIGTESGGILSYAARNRTATATHSQAGQALALAVYPNPTASTATVETAAATQLTLLDLTGRVLRRPATAARQHTLDVSGLAPGIYLVRAEAADGATAVQRLQVR